MTILDTLLCRRQRPQAHHESSFGFWVGTAFTVNYIMGCGFLGMPEGFVKAGLVLGPLVVLLFCWVMNLTKDYMCEVIGRAEALSKVPEIVAKALEQPGAEKGYGITTAVNPHASVDSDADSHKRGVAATSLSSSAHVASQVIHPAAEDYIVHEARKYEVTDLFNMFMGPRSRTVYVIILSGYMYGALWAYASVFAASFAANVPSIGGNTCNVEDNSNPECRNIFHLWLGVFALVAIPFACMELKEQVMLQVVMFGARVLVVLLLTATVLASFGCHGISFAELSPSSWGGAPLFNFPGLAVLMPVSVYAFIFHHSVPILAQPLKDKKGIRKVFAAAFIFTGVAYMSIGFIIALYFGDAVNSQCNLNWRNYVGCMAPPASWGNTTSLNTTSGWGTVAFALSNIQASVLDALQGNAHGRTLSAPACSNEATWATNCVDVSERPGYASVIAFIVLIFPALDVLSAFPLNAMTLGNNLMSACLGEAALAPPEVSESPTGDDVALLSQADGVAQASTRPWFLRSKRAHRWTLTLFRLLAAAPPVIGCFFVSDLGYILQFTGTIGVSIGFMIPAVLRVYSLAKERAVFVAITQKLRLRMPVSAATDHGVSLPSSSALSSLDGNAADVSELNASGAAVGMETMRDSIAQAMKAAPALREALSTYPFDKYFSKTLYTNVFAAYKIPQIVFVCSVAIAVFVFTQVAVDASQGK